VNSTPTKPVSLLSAVLRDGVALIGACSPRSMRLPPRPVRELLANLAVAVED
jgi:hypothetical protein